MTQTTTQPPTTESAGEPGLPSLDVPLSTRQILERLSTASRRGRLPGFQQRTGATLFSVAAFGKPFDGVLTATAEPASPSPASPTGETALRGGSVGTAGGVAARRDGGHSADTSHTRLTFRATLLPRMPTIFALILVVTIWPGVYFMDELIAILLPGLWVKWVTYWWYLPLTIIPTPFVWRSTMRKTRAAIHASAIEAIDKIAKELGAMRGA